MNQDGSEKVFCPRCGNEMNSNSRYCMKCGYLNPSDPANTSMKNYINKSKAAGYQVGSGITIIQDDTKVITSVASNAGNRQLCFLINYFIYVGIIILSFILILGNGMVDLMAIKNSIYPYVVFITSIIFLYIYSMELVFMKCNRKWWYALIPIYNLFILSDIVYKKKWLGIILLIPGIGQLFLIVTLYLLAPKFKCSGLLTVLFPYIFIPIMGFGSRLYEEVNYVSKDTTIEKDYKRKKIFFISLMVLLLGSGGLIFWNNIVDIKSNAVKVVNYYYVLVSKQVVYKAKYMANENRYVCDDYDYDEKSGVYYIWYADVNDFTYVPFHAFRDVVSGYVIIDNTSGVSKYYVSLSDGTYGFDKTLSDDIKIDVVVPYESVEDRKDLNRCTIIKRKSTLGEV